MKLRTHQRPRKSATGASIGLALPAVSICAATAFSLYGGVWPPSDAQAARRPAYGGRIVVLTAAPPEDLAAHPSRPWDSLTGWVRAQAQFETLYRQSPSPSPSASASARQSRSQTQSQSPRPAASGGHTRSSAIDASDVSSASDASHIAAASDAETIVPVLATSLPVVDGLRVRVGLRSPLRAHDGTELKAKDVALWLTSLASPGHPAAHVVLPVAGARERIEGRSGPMAIQASEDGRAVDFELAMPYPDFPALLARLPASIAKPSARAAGAWAGTGPFAPRIGRGGRALSTILDAFLGHRDGRPFVDELELRSMPFSGGVMAPNVRQQTHLIVGPRAPRQEQDHRTIGVRAPAILLVLRAGNRRDELRAEASLLRIDRALGRTRLVDRHLPFGSQPASSLDLGALFSDAGSRTADAGAGAARVPTSAEPSVRGRAGWIEVEVFVPLEGPVGPRFAERLQIDLLRAGLRARIRRATESEVRSARDSGAYDLLVDPLLVPSNDRATTTSRFHGLLELAARGRCLDASFDQALRAFGEAKESARPSILAKTEAELRRRCALIPLALTELEVMVRPEVSFAHGAPSGPLGIENAVLPNGKRP